MLNRTIRIVLTAATMSCLAIVQAATSALAHYVYESAWTFQSPEQCVWNRSEISHGSGGGFRKGNVKSAKQLEVGANFSCRQNKSRPPGWIIARPVLYYAGPSGTDVGICRLPNWIANSNNTYELITSVNHDYPPCGPGYYGTANGGAVLHNGQWVPSQEGVYLFSGWHWLGSVSLPCTPSSPEDVLQCKI